MLLASQLLTALSYCGSGSSLDMHVCVEFDQLGASVTLLIPTVPEFICLYEVLIMHSTQPQQPILFSCPGCTKCFSYDVYSIFPPNLLFHPRVIGACLVRVDWTFGDELM